MSRPYLPIMLTLMSLSLAAPGLGTELLVEAEGFSDLGGWVVDQQFMDVMGSPYLLAHGLGKPVTNASTNVQFPQPGRYRLHVRTRDWVPSHHPGTFQVIIDGRAAGTFGNQGEGWLWQDGGQVEIKQASAKIELADLTGFDGRCDALYFTDGQAPPPDRPGPDMAAWRRKLLGLPESPPSAGEFDVVVVGGGIAGTCAAVSAARLGLSVALIQDRPVLGGNASSELRIQTLPERDNNRPVVREVNSPYDPLGKAEPHPSIAHQARRDSVVEAEPNIKLFLEQHAYAASKDGARIVSVDARHVRTGKELRFAAPVFIDCTGDGSIGACAYAEFRMGREAQFQHRENLAPDLADRMVLGCSLPWYSREAAAESGFPEVPWATIISKEITSTGGGEAWKWEYGHYRDPIAEGEEIRDYLLRAIYGAWSTGKQTDPKQFARRELSYVPHVLGKREGRRLIGDYILSEHDVARRQTFPDRVAFGSHYIDLHVPSREADFVIELDPRVRADKSFLARDPYDIPYRCLYSKNVDNLLMAGRCISVTHVAHASTRMMNTGGQTGVAAGAAAFLCKKQATSPRGVGQQHIKELQDIVFERGAHAKSLKPKTGP